MTELKIQHILTLSYLLSLGARHNYVLVTTSSLGRNIKKSQQAASRHLVDLEQGRFIERMISGGGISVKVTAKGFAEVNRLSSILQKSIGSSPSYVDLEGVLVSGMGEGAYYMGLEGYTRQFKSKIGYIPFPGTLNVRLDGKVYLEAKRRLDGTGGVMIKGFSDGQRTYGWVRCFSAILNGTTDCMLVMLERTHHDDSIMEMISEVCIRDAARLVDGSHVSLRIQTDSDSVD